MKKLYSIGQAILVIGSVLYLLDILNIVAKIPGLATLCVRRDYPLMVEIVIGSIYAVALILMLVAKIAGKKKA